MLTKQSTGRLVFDGYHCYAATEYSVQIRAMNLHSNNKIVRLHMCACTAILLVELKNATAPDFACYERIAVMT